MGRNLWTVQWLASLSCHLMAATGSFVIVCTEYRCSWIRLMHAYHAWTLPIIAAGDYWVTRRMCVCCIHWCWHQVSLVHCLCAGVLCMCFLCIASRSFVGMHYCVWICQMPKGNHACVLRRLRVMHQFSNYHYQYHEFSAVLALLAVTELAESLLIISAVFLTCDILNDVAARLNTFGPKTAKWCRLCHPWEWLARVWVNWASSASYFSSCPEWWQWYCQCIRNYRHACLLCTLVAKAEIVCTCGTQWSPENNIMPTQSHYFCRPDMKQFKTLCDIHLISIYCMCAFCSCYATKYTVSSKKYSCSR